MTVINHKCFLKVCKYIEKKGVRHIHDNLSGFSYSSDESDKEQIRINKACLSKNIGHHFSNGNAQKKSVLYF